VGLGGTNQADREPCANWGGKRPRFRAARGDGIEGGIGQIGIAIRPAGRQENKLRFEEEEKRGGRTESVDARKKRNGDLKRVGGNIIAMP